MPFTHVVVHYHRPQADYDAWHVAILPAPHAAPTAAYSPALRHARTSFGAVFRIPRADLPATPHILPFQPHSSRSDSSPRPLSPDSHHVFLVQSSPHAYPHPARFNPIAITTTSPYILSIYHHQCVKYLYPPSHVYRHPQIPILYLLLSYPLHSQLRITQNQQQTNFCASPPSDALIISTSSNPQSFILSSEPPLLTSATYDIRHIVIAQAAQKPHASKRLPPPQSLTPFPVVSDPVQPLIVYSHVFSGPQPKKLSVRCVINHTSDPSVTPTSPYHEQNAFSIDLSNLPAHVIKAGLEIIPTSPFQKPLIWTPSLGYHVVLAETFNRLLPVRDVDHTIMYHRFGDSDDWEDWELHVWVEATDDYPARTMMVRSERPCQKGVLMFHLLAAIFPQDATVHVQPVRMKTMPGHTYTNEYGETLKTEPYRDADRRDVVRTWKSGNSALNIMHFVQGDESIHLSAPDAEEMNANRKVRLMYCRFEADDHKDWDLWTWDNSDPENHRVSLSSSSKTRGWAAFVLDRASYGAASSLNVIPRCVGDDWTEQDIPVRVWTAEMLKGSYSSLETVLPASPSHISSSHREKTEADDIPTFLIVQNSSVVLKRLAEVKRMIRAFVDGEHSVVITAPVPFGWILPSGRQRRALVTDTTLMLHDTNAYDLLEDLVYGRDNVDVRNLRLRKVQTLSHTEARFIISSEEVTFHEDFLVENVIVSVPGFEKVVLTWQFHDDWDKYYYPGTLGWEYTPEATSFRCFAPTADQVSVVLYSTPTGKAGRTLVPMRRIPNGCWKAIVDCDIKGRYYKLLAQGENKRLFPGVEVIDPYSRCNTAHTGRGLVFGTESTKIHPRPDVKPIETIVYELHLRDATIDSDSGVSQRGKFLGLTERGTCRKTQPKDCKEPLTPWEQEKMPGAVDSSAKLLDKYSTGLDHIVQMGVNAVQILPIQDFDNDEEDDKAYRWGYMPVHFNSPDGWYASETHTVARVTEFKRLVDAIHKVGLKVIMDVVYNHTAEDSNEYNLEARFSFNGLAPRYYYRTCGNTPIAHNGDATCGLRKAHDGHCGACYSNGSGCGNEFRSESPMGRKFIIDSLKYWATEYMVDGFRFDLLGLIDVDTVAQAAAELKKIDPNIIIYGEPWCGGLTPIRMTDKGSQRSKGFGVFNNTFRDAIRGSSFGVEETFLMDGGRLGEVKGGIVGSVDDFCDEPIETMNYVECHDNYTLWDHMKFYTRSRDDDIKFTEADMRRMDRLAAVIVFTSQGVPFIQIGQEMCRTKFDVENSYESPDEINMIRWETKEKEWSTVLYYRGLILLRRSHPEIFCLETAEEVRESITFYEDMGLSVPERCIAFSIKGSPGKLLRRLKEERQETAESVLKEESLRWTELVVILNPTPSAALFEIPGKSEDCVWFQVLDATTSGVRTIRGPLIASVQVPGRSAAILRRASERESADAQLELRLAEVTDSYCIFHGDDVISRYAVGLESEMTEAERAKHAELKSLRKQFLLKRKLPNSVKTALSASTTADSSAPEQ